MPILSDPDEDDDADSGFARFDHLHARWTVERELGPHDIAVDMPLLKEADAVLARRAWLPAERKSPTGPGSRSRRSQRRGALSEAAAARWLESHGFSIQRGYSHDTLGMPDIVILVNGLPRLGLEVMGAQERHREQTGACVPRNKVLNASRRHPWTPAFLLASYGDEPVPQVITITGFAPLKRLLEVPPAQTQIGWSRTMNHTLPLSALVTPDAMLSWLRTVAAT